MVRSFVNRVVGCAYLLLDRSAFGCNCRLVILLIAYSRNLVARTRLQNQC